MNLYLSFSQLFHNSVIFSLPSFFNSSCFVTLMWGLGVQPSFYEKSVIFIRSQKKASSFFLLLLLHCIQKRLVCLKTVRIHPNQRTETSVPSVVTLRWQIGRAAAYASHACFSLFIFVWSSSKAKREIKMEHQKCSQWESLKCHEHCVVFACETCDHSCYSCWGNVKHICRNKDQTDVYNGIVEVLMG